MRNIAVGVIVATTYFPCKVAMPVVFGMLFQQVLASVFSKMVTKAPLYRQCSYFRFALILNRKSFYLHLKGVLICHTISTYISKNTY